MNARLALLPALHGLLLLPCCTQAPPTLASALARSHTLLLASCTQAPPTAAIEPIAVVCADPRQLEHQETELDRRIAALSHAERVELARAIINTHDWGSTEAERQALAERFMLRDDALTTAMEQNLFIRPAKLPAGASPALRGVIRMALQAGPEDSGVIVPFIAPVIEDYLVDYPNDARAWNFIHFMNRFGDGDTWYSSTIVPGIRKAGIEGQDEARRLLHRNTYYHGCGREGCPYCPPPAPKVP